MATKVTKLWQDILDGQSPSSAVYLKIPSDFAAAHLQTDNVR